MKKKARKTASSKDFDQSDRLANQTSRKAIIVLGMHRSGTSALSGLLNRLGGDGPATPLGPNAHNLNGHFESRELYLLQDELLASAGSSWDDYRPLSESWMTSPKADEFRGRLSDLIKSEYGNSGFFIVKDPRICRLVSLWCDVLADMKVAPLFVHIHRSPLEVAQSLQKRDRFDLEYGSLVWLRHVLDAEAGSRGRIRSFTSYDHLMKDWPAEAEKIGGNLGISWPRFSASHAAELNAMVLPELRHNSGGTLLGSRIHSWWLTDVYEIFERWTENGEDTADHLHLDEIRNTFDESASVFNGVVHSKGKAAKAELDKARAAIAKTADQTEKQNKAIETLTAERDMARETGEKAKTQIVEYQNIIDTMSSERDSLADRLNQNQSMLAQRSAETDDALEELQVVRKALSDSEGRNDDAEWEQSLKDEKIRNLETTIVRCDNDISRMQILMLRSREDAIWQDPYPDGRGSKAPQPVPGSSAAPCDSALASDAGADSISNGITGSDRKMVDKLIAERDQALEAYKQAHVRNDAFLTSTSWRLTAPLRWMVLRFRK